LVTRRAGPDFPENEERTMFGTIDRINSKGFGFIRSPGEPDYFFHARDLRAGLEFGEHLIELPVRFSIGRSAKGFVALNVFALDEEPPEPPANESKLESPQRR
jgi:cold shock CspA family protein